MPHGREVIYASTATTATHSLPVNLPPARGVILLVDVTAETDTAVVTPSIQVKDGNDDWVDIWTAAAAISATGNYSYAFYPAMLNGNFTEVDGIMLPDTFRITFTHADADSLTYSVVALWLR